MKIRLSTCRPAWHHDDAKKLPRNFSNARALPERTSTIALGVAGSLTRWRTDFLFDCEIFPPSILRFDPQWKREGRAPAIGDVILQRAFLPPIGVGVCMEFAVRVCALIDEPTRCGFAYETLAGHPESGVSEFFFEEKNSGLFFTIHTFSQPGHWTSRLGKYVFTLPYQAWCTRRALAHVRGRFFGENNKAELARF